MTTHNRTLFLTGANGKVGYELAHLLPSVGSVVATTRDSLDLMNEAAIRDAIRDAKPRVVVNAAAYTAVDAAESDQSTCTWLNTDVPRILAEEAQRADAWLVHYSTDYVFDGSATRPYREEDPVAPLGVYGRSKADGERAVREACTKHLMLRVAWVYGTRGRNFLRTILRLAGSGQPLRIVNDQIGSPTWSRSIAEATTHAVMGLITDGEDTGRAGTYHVSGPDQCSWFEFATAILCHPLSASVPTLTITAIPSSEYPTPAQRPAYSVLDASRFMHTFNWQLPGWHEQLNACLEAESIVGNQ
jgi:dTDP-4-dehydrorhamnose reductase